MLFYNCQLCFSCYKHKSTPIYCTLRSKNGGNIILFGGEGGIRPTASTIVLLSDSLQASPASLTRASNLPPEASLRARSPHGFESPFSCFEQNKRSTTYVMLLSFGGEGGIRTLAQVAPPKALAKPPLRPLGYFSVPNNDALLRRRELIIAYFEKLKRCFYRNLRSNRIRSSCRGCEVRWNLYVLRGSLRFRRQRLSPVRPSQDLQASG